MLAWARHRFELGRGGSAHNSLPMEGLRGLAVFLVFLVHYATLATPWLLADSPVLAVSEALHTLGMAGVDLFFILSGYLIYGSLIARPQRFLDYMGRRVRRIYPAFLTVFAVYVALSIAVPAENKIPPDGWDAALYLLQNLLLLPGLFPITPLITVAWSLSYEVFYYLAVPGVVAMLSLRARSPAWRLTLFACVLVLALVSGALWAGPVRLAMFIFGIGVHEAMLMSGGRTPGGRLAGGAVLLGLAAQLLPLDGSAAYAAKVAALGTGFFLLCWHGFQAPAASLPRALTWTPLRWLGNMSYSYYLIHGLTLKCAFVVLALGAPAAHQFGAPTFLLVLGAMFLLTLVPSAVLFLLVERPFSVARPSAKSVAGPGLRPLDARH